MRRTNCGGGFFLALIINLLLNLDGLIPAAVLLILHFWLGWPIWLFWAAVGVWLAWIVLYMCVIGWVSDCANEPEKPKENKNPYSVGNKGVSHGIESANTPDDKNDIPKE